MMQQKGEATIGRPKSQTRRYRPKLGQHFLHDSQYRARILDALDLRPSDVVIEIGPGRGAMTSLLAKRARQVIAIEVDRALAQALQQEFPDSSAVQIIPGDVLNVDFAALCRQAGISQAFVFGNLPYYITSPILHRLYEQRTAIRSMGLLMQREVAERLTAAPGSREYGYLTVATQLFTQPEIALAVPPGAFSPAPQVQSALVVFQMRAKFGAWAEATYREFLEFVKRGFAQKRKNLLNNLAATYPRPALLKALEVLDKPAHLRAEQLSIEELAALFERLHATS